MRQHVFGYPIRGVATSGTAVTPTGVSGTSSAGSVGLSVTLVLTSLLASASLGTATLSASIAPTGITVATGLGTPTPVTNNDATATPTGLAATGAVGTPVLSASAVLSGLAGTSTLAVPGLSLALPVPGQGATAATGAVGLNATAAVSGLAATGATGTPVLSGRVLPSGLATASSVGAIATVPGRLLVAGLGGTAGLGTATPTSVVLGAAAPTTERWLSPRLPADDRMVGVLQTSLDRLERTQGRTPVVLADRRVTTAVTLVDADGLVLVDCTGGGVTITLPPASAGNRGRRWAIKKVDSTANNVTIAAASGDTIDGSTTQAWNTQWHTVWVLCALTDPPGTYNWVTV